MKLLLIFLLSIIPALSFADTVDCYSGDKLIYSGKAFDVIYQEGLFAFEENNKVIFVTGNCVVKTDKVIRRKRKHK